MSFEKQKIRSCFNKAAYTYDQAAILQQEAGTELIKKIASLPFPTRLLDLAAGTGYCTELLTQALPKTHIIGLDFAYNMLKTAKNKLNTAADYLCADFDELPLAMDSIDMIFSNFSLQWSLDLHKTLAAAKAVLKKQGYFIFSTLTERTLYELRTSSMAIDGAPRTNQFLTYAIVEQLLARHFDIIDLKSETKVLYFDSIFEIMHQLKEIGANHVLAKKDRRFGSKNYFIELAARYEQYRHHGKLPATYEIIYAVVQK